MTTTEWIINDPGRAQVHAGDNSQVNDSSFVMEESEKNNI